MPGRIIGINYQLEYAQDRLEIQQYSFPMNSNIIIDNLLATGGTASVATKLIKEAGGNLIGYGFIVELTKLRGRKVLDPRLYVESVIKY